MVKQKEQEDIEIILVDIRRVAKVVKGGRRFAFSALVICGDKQGKVGYGSANGPEVLIARSKAEEQAKKNMSRVALKEGRTIHHDIEGRFGSCKINLRSAPSGTGVIAGGALRAIFECLGVQDVVVKSVGRTTNPYNMVKACFNAFTNMSSPRVIAEKRSMKIGDIISRREASTKGKKDHEPEENH